MLPLRRGENPSLPQAANNYVAITRKNYRVLFHDLTEAEYALLKEIEGQRRIAELLGKDFNLSTLRIKLVEWTT